MPPSTVEEGFMERPGSHPRTVPVSPQALRQSIVTLALGSLLAIHGPTVGGTDALAAGWKQDGFSASHQSYNRHETTITAANVATLVERWRTPNVGAVGAPQVADGRLFVTTGDDAVALATDDGDELWREAYEDGDDCGLFEHVLTPDGKLTVALGCIFGGSTLAFDVATGQWSGPPPSLHAGNVHFAVRGDDVFSLSTIYGSGGPLLAQLTGYPGLVYFGNLGARFSGPTVLRGHVFVGVDSSIKGFDLNDCPNPNLIPPLTLCSAKWTTTLPARATTPVGFRGDRVAVASVDGTLGVYDAATGDLQWSAQVPSGVQHAPAITRTRIFLAGKRGVIHVFDARGCGAATCAPLGRFKLGRPITAPPVVAGDVLYAGTKDGRLLAFAASGCGTNACAPLWSVDAGGGAIVSGPIVIDGAVYAGTADGQLLSYGLPPE